MSSPFLFLGRTFRLRWLVFPWLLAMLAAAVPVRAVEPWVDISTPLVQRITNSGKVPGYPGGCSGVVVNR